MLKDPDNTILMQGDIAIARGSIDRLAAPGPAPLCAAQVMRDGTGSRYKNVTEMAR